MQELSEKRPKKFLEIYDEYDKRKREKSRKDYESHKPFSLTPTQQEKAKYCLNCGTELPTKASFCSNCGTNQG